MPTSITNSSFVPFHRPLIGEEEIQEVVATLRSGWLTSGERTQRFEKEFREYVQASHSLALNSCTAALHLGLVAIGAGSGDEVITTPLTFCATVNSILHTGAKAVLADVDQDGNIDPERIAALITARTKAILPVHLGGLPCNMDAIWDLARKHNLYVIEDAAHACGARYQGHPIGQTTDALCSDVTAYSFYATKNLTTGEGGMATTPHAHIYERMRMLALHGISRDAWARYTAKGSWLYDVLEPGFKYNLSDIQSAIGIHQLHKLNSFIEERRRQAERYSNAFNKYCELETPRERQESRHAWHLYLLKLNLEELSIDRARFIELLRAQNIGTSVHFIPIPKLRFFAELADSNPCPRAEEIYQRIISLPIYPGLTEAEQERVISAVTGIVSKYRRSLYAVGA